MHPQQYLRQELGDGTINIMKMLKNTLDPRGIMNPGKVGFSSSWSAGADNDSCIRIETRDVGKVGY